jgi:hypothetical protein
LLVPLIAVHLWSSCCCRSPGRSWANGKEHLLMVEIWRFRTFSLYFAIFFDFFRTSNRIF